MISNPLAQHVLLQPQISGRLGHRHTAFSDQLDASSLNSGLKLRLPIAHPVSVNAQMRPSVRAVVPIADPAMVVNDRGSKLEIFPTKRATVGTDSAGHAAVQRVDVASAEKPFSRLQPGLVFNHAYQQYGYITGEIAFRLKGGRSPGADFSPALYPNLKKVGTLDMYAVNATNPGMFLAVLKRLQARTDLDWVVPTVTYFPTDIGSSRY